MPWISESAPEITWPRLEALMRDSVAEAKRRIGARPRRVLLLPPDITRAHSGVGRLTEILYQEMAGDADVHVIPTLGQHVPHTKDENARMFGSIPHERIHAHDWCAGCIAVGEVPAAFVRQVSGGVADWPIPIHLNRMLRTSPCSTNITHARRP